MSNADWNRLLSNLEARAKEIQFGQDEAARHALSTDQVRVLQYFWRQDTQKARASLPLSAMLFFEADRHEPGAEDVREAQALEVLAQLIAKDYIGTKDGRLVLTADGTAWLLRQHPTLVQWWQKRMAIIPPMVQMVMAAIGFIAAVFTLSQLIFGK